MKKFEKMARDMAIVTLSIMYFMSSTVWKLPNFFVSVTQSCIDCTPVLNSKYLFLNLVFDLLVAGIIITILRMKK